LPGSPFEVVEPQLLFQLLMGLLANPTCLDGGSQSAQISWIFYRCRPPTHHLPLGMRSPSSALIACSNRLVMRVLHACPRGVRFISAGIRRPECCGAYPRPGFPPQAIAASARASACALFLPVLRAFSFPGCARLVGLRPWSSLYPEGRRGRHFRYRNRAPRTRSRRGSQITPSARGRISFRRGGQAVGRPRPPTSFFSQERKTADDQTEPFSSTKSGAAPQARVCADHPR
jgi:hypothetical protein